MADPVRGSLADYLRHCIYDQGPVSVAEYMGHALAHPRYGYYMSKNPFGTDGDFTTAPEISQIFGELIGLWCAAVWQEMGAPSSLRLVELGPGRGTLMSDVVRAGAGVPGFINAIKPYLVEISPLLRQSQKETLENARLEHSPSWCSGFAEVPDGPLVIIANEFFDALPIHQFQRTDSGWSERLIDNDPDRHGGFRFVLSRPDMKHPENLPVGSILETCPAGEAIISTIAERLVTFGGAALIIDYGYLQDAYGETLQAVRGHAFADPLDAPGEADLTAHVDFAALAAAAGGGGAAVHGPLPQGAFLQRLGIAERAGKLLERATAEQASDIRSAVDRLVSPEHMGSLFKVMALTSPGQASPPGFWA